ncbi:MAG: cache domain-containing protein [Pseudomonadota bacterium]
MKTIIKALAAASFVIAAGAAYAVDMGTPQEAATLVKKAAAYLKATDRKKALAEFNDPKGKFVDRDLYIFVLDLKGNVVALGSDTVRKTVGMNLSDMRDVDGRYFVRNMLTMATTTGSGWVDFKFPNHLKNDAIEAKVNYIQKVDDLIIGCGAFKF